jgi:hypothetical protein
MKSRGNRDNEKEKYPGDIMPMPDQPGIICFFSLKLPGETQGNNQYL